MGFKTSRNTSLTHCGFKKIYTKISSFNPILHPNAVYTKFDQLKVFIFPWNGAFFQIGDDVIQVFVTIQNALNMAIPFCGLIPVMF